MAKFPNAYAAPCVHCAVTVKPGDGWCVPRDNAEELTWEYDFRSERFLSKSAWLVEHRDRRTCEFYRGRVQPETYYAVPEATHLSNQDLGVLAREYLNISITKELTTMRLFEYAVLYVPRDDDGKVRQDKTTLLVEPTFKLAETQGSVERHALRDVTLADDQSIDYVQVLVRPFGRV